MFIYIPLELLQLLCQFDRCFTKGIFSYFVGIIWALLTSSKRKVTTNLKRQCFFVKKHIASWERFVSDYKWNHLEIANTMLKILVRKYIGNFTIHKKLLIAIDTTLIAKNTKKMFGVQKWNNHSGNAEEGKYIFGHHWGLLGLVGKFLDKRFIFFPLLMKLITGQTAPWQWICGTDGIRRMTFWDVVHSMIYQFQSWIGLEIRIVVDAYFSNSSFIAPLMAKGTAVITRLRCNGVANLDIEQPTIGKRGRPRKKGKQIKVMDLVKMVPAQEIEVLLYGKMQKMEVYVKDLLMLGLPEKVRTVVVKTKTKTLAFISTDLSIGAQEIIEIYGSRFSIEISIREMKTNLGLEDYQFQSYYGTLRFVHLVMFAYNVGKILLLNPTNLNWLIVEDGVDKSWVSLLSFNRLKYGLRKHALGKIVFDDSAECLDSFKKSDIKDALLEMIA